MSKNLFIVAVDDDDCSRRAIAFAAERAKLAGATIKLLHVLEWSPYSFLTQEELAERHGRRKQEMARAEEKILQTMASGLKAQGLTVEIEARYGHVAETICDVASEDDALQIFVGRTGTSQLTNRIFGSTVGALVQASPVPVTVVP